MMQRRSAREAAAAADMDDEEMAYQLQLEAINESTHGHSRVKSQPSPSSQDGASYFIPVSSHIEESWAGTRGLVEMLISMEITCCTNAPVPTHPSNDSESMLPGQDLLRVLADRGVAKKGKATASTRSDRDPFLEMECVICTEMQPHTSFISTTGCAHEYCIQCCHHYAEEKVASGGAQIPCPHEVCAHKFDVQQCGVLLSPPSFKILTTRQTEAAIPSSLKVYCPYNDCSAFMENAEGGRGSTFVECGACHRGFCVNCNIPWHADRTCSQYRAEVVNQSRSGDEKLLDLANREKWQSCPECKRVIELKDGCYHMTCICGNEFCYTCGAKWKNKVATCKCKLWDESNIIRRRAGRPRPIHMQPFY